MIPYADKYIDLHLHLDGAITVDIAKHLAALQDIPLPVQDDEALLALLSVPEDCENLNDFLSCFDFPLSLLQTKKGISEAVYLVLENIRQQNVIYAEIRFAPQLHTTQGLTQEDAVQAALSGLKQSKLPGNLILCCMRGKNTHQANLETVKLAKKYLVEHGGVVALDLAGAEALYPTEDYKDVFALAAEYGIPFTIHAGEASGPGSVRTAMELGARRIGHGVRIYEDKSLMKQIRDRGIFLEMCPTSNRQTRAIEDMRQYPLVKYLDMGIKVTLNTDDMGISRITLPQEFRYTEELLGLTGAQERQLLRNSIDAAFTDSSTKKWLRETLLLTN